MVTLYEREALVDELVSLVNRAGGHRPCVMFVSGEAGLGKTAVLTAAINSVPFDGQVQVASVQAPSVEAGIPFGLAVQLAEALDSSFSEATGNLAGLGPADARVARFMGMLDLVRRVAASRPLVLAVDDLHWADLDSLALLGFLVRRLRSQPTTIIATLRPFPLPAWEMASELVHDGIADVRSLSPLSTAAMQQMLDEAAAGPVPPGVVQRAAALSAGNPLLLEQLARSLRAGHGLPDRLPGGHRLGAFLARFAGVRELGLRYASATSVFGQSFRPSLAADVAQLSEQEAAEALAELCANGLLSQVRPGSVCFTHSLVRQAFYDELPALTRAGVGSIETGAADAGRRYLTAAVGLARGHTDLRVRLAIGWASLMLGDSRAALDSAVELRGPGDDPDGLRREAARLRLHALVAAGRYREAVAGLTTAAGYLKKMYPADAATLLVEGSTLALPASGPATVRSMVATARRLSWADDAAGQRVMALEQLLDALACQRPADEAAPPGGILETGAVPGGPGPDARGWGPAGQPHGSPQVSQPSSPELQDSVVAYARLETDLASERFAATDVAYTEAAAVMAQAYVPRLRAMFDMAYAIGMARRGALRQAAVLFERASECDLSALTGLRSAIGRAYVLTELGQCDVAAEYCAQVRSRAGASLTDLPFLQLWLGRTKAVLALEADDVEGAVAEVRPLRGIAIGAGILEPCVVPWIDVAARALIAAEDLAAACDLLDWAATITAQLSCAWPRAVILGGRAELMARRGNLEGAIGLFDAALSCHQQQPLPLATVETLLTYGCVLRRAGRLSAARPLLLRGMQLAESCAAGRLAAACRRELRIADGRRRRRGEPDGALTASEARVIDLACTGLSNAEIARSLYVSVRTVESHMGHAYTKLGVASRRQLLALAMTKDVPRRVLASGRPLSSYPGPG
jgi:DNA-binding CsgD family transcriptional regulator